MKNIVKRVHFKQRYLQRLSTENQAQARYVYYYYCRYDRLGATLTQLLTLAIGGQCKVSCYKTSITHYSLLDTLMRHRGRKIHLKNDVKVIGSKPVMKINVENTFSAPQI